jgi:hypothetical protein
MFITHNSVVKIILSDLLLEVNDAIMMLKLKKKKKKKK